MKLSKVIPPENKLNPLAANLFGIGVITTLSAMKLGVWVLLLGVTLLACAFLLQEAHQNKS